MISPDRSVELLPDLIVRVIGAVEGEAVPERERGNRRRDDAWRAL